jgi:ABC-2 type transport system ATP-binding protein
MTCEPFWAPSAQNGSQMRRGGAARLGSAAVTEPAVEVEELVIRYGELTAVDGVSFTAPTARVTAVLGPNGAGKTSTIEALEGYRRPASGRARVLGLDPLDDHHELVRRIGVMLQSGGVYRAIRVEEAVRLFAAFYDDPVDPDELVGRVGLDQRRRSPWRTLSGGEQQRLSLALALVGRPDLVFLDEPTAGLDVGGRRLVHDLIRRLRADGVTVLLATHDLSEAEGLADHVVIIDRGQVVAAGTPDELVTGPAAEVRFRAQPGLDTVSLAARLGTSVVETTPGEYVVAREGDPATVAQLAAWLAEHDLALGDLRARRQRLEDVFVRLTEEPSGEAATHVGPPRRRRRR